MEFLILLRLPSFGYTPEGPLLKGEVKNASPAPLPDAFRFFWLTLLHNAVKCQL
jgi:hypothetical protein